MTRTCEARFVFRPEVRAEGSGRLISGHAALFDVVADIGYMFSEKIQRGAFARAIRNKQDVRCLVNHDPNLVLGRVSNNTLELKEDNRGLWFRCDVARTAAGDDLLAMVRRGDLSECSFGFTAVKEEWTETKDSAGNPRALRTLLDCDLFDVSAVTYPAYDGTDVNADERSRMALMFAEGPPAGAPLELRSRIAQAVKMPAISDEEYIERLRARKQAESLLEGQARRDYVTQLLDSL